jgi:hypothetical protein
MLNCDRSPCSHSPSRALLVPWGVFAALAACSSQDKPADPSAGDRVAAQFCLNKSALPTCSNGQDGQVYFVWSDSAFYVCRSSTRTWVQTDLNGLNAAARVTPASSSSQCSSGGSTIQFGLDRNRNGKLDNWEVSSAIVVCNGANGDPGPQGATGATGATGDQGPSGTNGTNGAPGVTSLVRQDNEPAGANCSAGGVRIESGLDTNGDGTLDANEVMQTGYTCNGQNGFTTLMVSIPEPAGANCLNGGVTVMSGLDLNGNGTLDPTEAGTRLYVCNGGPGSTGLDGGVDACAANAGTSCNIGSGLGACENGGIYDCMGTCLPAVSDIGSGAAWQFSPAPNGSWDWNCDGEVTMEPLPNSVPPLDCTSRDKSACQGCTEAYTEARPCGVTGPINSPCCEWFGDHCTERAYSEWYPMRCR